MPDRVLGVDLGTTNSAIATLDVFGYPEMVVDQAGEQTTPSAVYFHPNGRLAVGRDAREALAYDPERVALFFKRMMGDPEYGFAVDGSVYDATMLSAEVLKCLARAARSAGLAGAKTVVTVPAYFRNVQREATLEAGRRAGLDVLCTVNEPTAAAIAYGSRHPELTGTIMVYDLGGGTFDVTLLDYSPSELRVIASIGDHYLGGAQWDDVIIDIVAAQLLDATGVDVKENPMALGELRLAAEHAKQSLSARDYVKVPVSSAGARHSATVTRADFEAASAHLLDSTRQLIVEMLRDSGVRWPDIQSVLLVGGSTRMPQVRELLTTLSGKNPLADINPDEAVALGAALRAAEVEASQTHPVAPAASASAGASGIAVRRTVDVTSHSLGYVQCSADGHRYINGVVIPRNTSIPAKQSRPSEVETRAGTPGILEVLVFQGDAQRVLDNEFAGAYRVEAIPHTTGASTVDVSFGYDVSGVVVVEAFDRNSGQALAVSDAERPSDLSWTDLDPSEHPQVQSTTIMLAIDTSGSMCGTLEEAKNAARELLKQIDLDRMPTGIAEFGMNAGIVLKPCSDADALNRAIERLSADNGTPMGQALQACISQLQTSTGVLVLLTDGEPNDRSEALRAADELKEANVVIYTVGVSGADMGFLRQIASFPDAIFEPSAADLVGTFRGIGRDIAAGGAGLSRRV